MAPPAEEIVLNTLVTAQVGATLTLLKDHTKLERDDDLMYDTADVPLDIALCNYTSAGWEFCCGALQCINQCCSHDRFIVSNTTKEFLIQQ